MITLASIHKGSQRNNTVSQFIKLNNSSLISGKQSIISWLHEQAITFKAQRKYIILSTSLHNARHNAQITREPATTTRGTKR